MGLIGATEWIEVNYNRVELYCSTFNFIAWFIIYLNYKHSSFYLRFKCQYRLPMGSVLEVYIWQV